MTAVFQAAEQVQITGFQKECDCAHCGRPLKLGVTLAGFVGAFGADCLAKAAAPQVVGPYKQKLAADTLKQRAIVAGKGEEYAVRAYGWKLNGPAFLLTLISPLKSI